MQILSSFEEMKDVPSISVSQYVRARGAVPGKSAAAVNLHERPAVVSVSTDAAAHTEPAEGRMY